MKDILFNKNFTCVAVSKTKPKEDIQRIYNLGHKDFGENKVQELEDKYNNLPKDIRWHMIGHLQTNKVKKVIPIVSLIHSVDSLKLLKVINKESKKIKKITNCLIQVNISNEKSKYGFRDKELTFLKKSSLNEYPNVRIKGLMGMASFSDEQQVVKEQFNKLKKLYDQIQGNIKDISILSMGMSNDYKIAIETGSNMIRVGSKIFGERNYQ